MSSDSTMVFFILFVLGGEVQAGPCGSSCLDQGPMFIQVGSSAIGQTWAASQASVRQHNVVKPEQCHTAVEGEQCYNGVEWARDYGILLHPQVYEGLTGGSSFKEFQAVLHKIPHENCPQPCNLCHTAVEGETCFDAVRAAMSRFEELDSDVSCSGVDVQDAVHKEDPAICPKPCNVCHTATLGEPCFEGTVWALTHGIHTHSEWYNGLTDKSSFEDFQTHLYKQNRSRCKLPCRKHSCASVATSAPSPPQTGNDTSTPPSHTPSPTVEDTVAATPMPTLLASTLTMTTTVKASTSARTLPPTSAPTSELVVVPTSTPTILPTIAPSVVPTVAPTEKPTLASTVAPSNSPTLGPSPAPTLTPMDTTGVSTTQPSSPLIWPADCGLLDPCASIGSASDPMLLDILMKGPSDVWFGIGPGATAMPDSFAVIALGNGVVVERRLGAYEPGVELSPPQFDVVSNTVDNGVRSIHLQGPSAGRYVSLLDIDTAIFIWAKGSTSAFGYHAAHS